MARVTAISTTEVGPTSGHWMKDYTGDRRANLPGGIHLNSAEFYMADPYAVAASATANAAATTISVQALPVDIPSGTQLMFTGGVTATTTADADAGDNSISVTALSGPVADGEYALYRDPATMNKYVISGTLIGRTFAERDAKTGFGPADVANDDQIYLLLYDVSDVTTMNEGEAYRHGCLVAENYLPDWATMTQAEKDWVRANYECILGAP